MIRCFTCASLGIFLGIGLIVASVRAEDSLSDRMCNASLEPKRTQTSKVRDEINKAGEAAAAVSEVKGTVEQAGEAMNLSKTMYGTMERLNPGFLTNLMKKSISSMDMEMMVPNIYISRTN